MTLFTDHVVTGSTGFIGRHLLAELLANRATGGVFALARSNRADSVIERVASALEGTPYGSDRLVAVEAEVTRSECGVSDADVRRITRRCARRVFWHVAASLRWERTARASVFSTNVEGTRNAVALARRLGSDLFIHVSTAYTCGSIDGLVPEALHHPPRFNNVYEESKNAAEHYVSGASDGTLRTVIVRPSIVVGSLRDYRSCGSYTGLYGFLTELRRFKRALGDSRQGVRFQANRDAVLSFISVDHVAADLSQIASHQLAVPAQRIHHVSGDSGPTLGELVDHTFDRFGLRGRIELLDRPVDQPTALERFFAKRMEFFAGYVRSTKRFQRSFGPPRSLSFAQIAGFIDNEVSGGMPCRLTA
jgi:nucleoside-diphosphate-sugar epimerase